MRSVKSVKSLAVCFQDTGSHVTAERDYRRSRLFAHYTRHLSDVVIDDGRCLMWSDATSSDSIWLDLTRSTFTLRYLEGMSRCPSPRGLAPCIRRNVNVATLFRCAVPAAVSCRASLMSGSGVGGITPLRDSWVWKTEEIRMILTAR